MIKACERHLRDLAKSSTKDYPYKFDAAKAARVCEFIEQLPHTKGQWARKRIGYSNRIVLEAWQVFIVCMLFGWVEKSTGFRKFDEAYVCVPRKNAKSTLAAAIGLYMLVADGEYGAEVYSGATTEKQALVVFDCARLMAKNTPALREWFGIETLIKSIFCEEDGSRFEPLVGDPGDGGSPSCAINDEYHEQATARLHDTMKTGMGAREQGLLINITTAGSNVEGPCHILQDDVEKLLDGIIENENLFGIIYTITVPADLEGMPEGENFWKTDEALRMANPNYGVSVFQEFLQKAQREAIQSSHKQNVFKTKHLNIWVNAATAWMNMDAWRRQADPTLKLEDFIGESCYEGVDLGAKIDLASRAKVFVRHIDDAAHYFYFGRHYVPSARAFDGDHPNYEKWVLDKKLIAIEGVEIKLGLIQREIREDFAKFDYKAVAFDPWSALQMRQELEDEFTDDVIIEVDQKVKNLSDAMKEVEAAVLAGRFHHDGDPVATWAVSNVIAKEDANENVFPRKEKHGKNKIDPISALFNAINRAYHAPAAKKSIYSTRGLLSV